MRCEICDTEIPDGATECPHCGFEVEWMRGDTEHSDSNRGKRVERFVEHRQSSGRVRALPTERDPIYRRNVDRTGRAPISHKKEQKKRGAIIPVLIAVIICIFVSGTAFYIYLRLTNDDTKDLTANKAQQTLTETDESTIVSQPYTAPSLEEQAIESSNQDGADGFIGLDVTINLETNLETLRNTNVYNVAPIDDSISYTYKDISLFGKYPGNLYVFYLSETGIYRIDFDFDDSIDCGEVIKEISAIIGQPVHKENYNDQRFYSAYTVWYIDDIHYY